MENEIIKFLMSQIELKDQEIAELKRNAIPPTIINYPPSTSIRYPWIPNPIIGPSSGTLIMCDHEYPFPWHGTVPSPCKKCGKSQQTATFFTTGANSVKLVP